jgi:hypothetical protein
VLCATHWTNYMLENLRALPEGLVRYIVALSQDRALSDLFTTNFNYPERQWDCFASPARTGKWLTEHATPAESRALVTADA